MPKAYFLDEQLLEAELLLLDGKAAAAQVKLDELSGQTLSEENQSKHAELVARSFLATGAPRLAAKKPFDLFSNARPKFKG